MKNILISLRFLFLMVVITGIAYPLFITGFAQIAFNNKANGSLVSADGQFVGSMLLAQEFKSEKYFWGRPSASGYGTVPSGGSNLAPTNNALSVNVENQKKLYGNKPGIPADLLFASGSGLDPHITPEAALFQVERIAAARNFNDPETEGLRSLIGQYTEKRDILVLGEDRVNVLLLNTALDKMDGRD